MESGLLIGILGFLGLVALIAIRIPIAYTMILVGIIGTSLLSGPKVVLNNQDLRVSQVTAVFVQHCH